MPLYPHRYKLSAEDNNVYRMWLRWILALYGALALISIALVVIQNANSGSAVATVTAPTKLPAN